MKLKSRSRIYEIDVKELLRLIGNELGVQGSRLSIKVFEDDQYADGDYKEIPLHTILVSVDDTNDT